MRYDLIIFDCDGVLVDSEVLAREAMVAVFGAAGLPVTDAMLREVVGMKFADIVAHLEARTGRSLPQESLEALWPTTRASFRTSLKATPGLVDFLVADRTARCVASSSHHERIALSLEITELTRFFAPTAIFSSTDVARGKPAPDLVLHAAATMGAVPSRCLVIEDSPLGVQGAVAAGMDAIGYVGGAHCQNESAAVLMEAGALQVESSWAGVARWLRERASLSESAL